MSVENKQFLVDELIDQVVDELSKLLMEATLNLINTLKAVDSKL